MTSQTTVMGAELIEIYLRWQVWSTSKGYFIKDSRDNTPVYYNVDYCNIQAWINNNKNR